MEESHNERADELLKEADRIEEPSKDLERDINDAREDWDAKKKTESAPGAIKSAKEAEAEKEAEKGEPNEFEFEEHSPETAEAQGPAALSDSDDEDDDDSDDDDSDDS